MSAEVQKSVFVALQSADITGVKQIRDTPIAIPGASDFPFIEIGASQDIPADAGGDEGVEHYIDVHAYSRSPGQRELKDIAVEVKAALHGRSLSVIGKASAHCFFDAGRVVEERDGLTRHSVQTFQIIHRE